VIRWAPYANAFALIGLIACGCMPSGEPLTAGSEAPDFTAESIDGHTLTRMLEQGPVVLVLLRGMGDRDGREHLKRLVADIEQFRSRRATVAVVIREKGTTSLRLWRDLKYDNYMECFFDQPHKEIGKAYHQQWTLFASGLKPALFVISQERKLIFAYYGSKASDIPDNQTVLNALDSI